LRISQQAGRTRCYADLQIDQARLCNTDLLLSKGTVEANEKSLEASNHEDNQRCSEEHELRYCSMQQKWLAMLW
jgi:hypothetical protein